MPIHIPRLEILQGERVAIVGPNGSGKSTLVKLLARIYDVESGGVFIAGSDVRRSDLTVSARLLVTCPHACSVSSSVADNLRIGRPETSDDELREALADRGLQRFLK